MTETHLSGAFGKLPWRTTLVVLAVGAVAWYLPWDARQAHILYFLPLVLALGACLGMQAFMDGSRGGHGGRDPSRGGASREDGE